MSRTNRRKPEGAHCSIQTGKSAWNERKLPDHWDKDELQFFANWMRGLASLHGALTLTAAQRLKLLRRGRRIYFKLAHQLTEQIRKTAVRTEDAPTVTNGRG
jgi:hypothetical protein